MGLTNCVLGSYLELCSNRNTDLLYGLNDVRGVNNQKQFMSTKADLNGRDLSKFQIVNPGEFGFFWIDCWLSGEVIFLCN